MSKVVLEPNKKWFYFLFLLILACSTYHKIHNLQEYALRPLDPDAIGYKAYAETMQHPLDTSTREPAFVWFVKGMFTIFGSSVLNLRLMTMALSVGCLIVLFLLARSFFNDFVALSAALLYALNPHLHTLSVRGLRHELLTLFVLIFVWFMLKRNLVGSIKNALWLGFMGGMGLLTSVSMATFIFPAMIYTGIKRKWHISRISLALLLSLVMISPFFIRHKIITGEYFYALNQYAKWFRNYDFAGQPGQPTREECSENGYAGSNITPLSYIFKLHSPGEIVKRSVKGFWRVYVGKVNAHYLLSNPITLELPTLAWLLVLFYLLGIWGVSQFRRKVHGVDFLVLFFFAAAPLSFLTCKHFDLRLVSHLAPFTVCLTTIGIWKGTEFLHNLLHECSRGE